MDLSPKQTALVTDVQRFSRHDGPGIRTTVFLKGCNLHCRWCHNPETLSFEPQTLFYPEKCIGCGHCAEGCFSGARVLCGREVTAEELLAEVLQDKPYYGEKGGVTVSGGEPTCRAAFVAEFLALCHAAGLRTAIESNMAAPRESVMTAVRHTDLVMCDVKHSDPVIHREVTGGDLNLILANIRSAAAAGKPILLRTPVIPGVNAEEAVIGAIAAFAAELPTLVCYELLPYHPLGKAKAGALGMESYDYETPSAALMERLASAAKERGVPLRIANRTK